MESPQSLTALFPFLAIGGSIALFWGQAKDLLVRVIRIFIVEVKVDGQGSRALTYYLSSNGKSLPTNTLRYDSTFEYVLQKKKIRMVLMQILNGLKSQLFWLDGTLLALSDLRGVDKETNTMTDTACSIHFLRGTLNHEDLIVRAIEWYEDRDDPDKYKALSSRFYIRRFVGEGASNRPDDIRAAQEHAKNNSAPVSAQTYQSLQHNRLVNYARNDLGYAKRDFYYVFNETTQRIHDDVVRWLKSKEWYQEKGLLHRRGALLHGPAGSGKTAAIRKIAQEMDVPLFLFELNTMSDREFINFWEQAANSGTAIIVFEDLDCSFKKRENISKGGKLSFECVLNCISGLNPSEGVYLFVTTNRLDYLDDALGVPNERGISTRPGRLDSCFEVGNITQDQKRKVADHFLDGYPEVGAKLIEESNGCTAAQFTDMCSQKALELYWEKQT